MRKARMEINPYAPPQVDIVKPLGDSDFERIRQEHINAEATLKSVGVLYYLGTAVLILTGVFALLSVITGTSADAEALVLGLIFTPLGILQGFAAYGLRRLKSWARIPTTFLSVFGLIGFPVGTLISAYILYTLWSAKGRFVMTPEYKEIIAATPHVKRKTSMVLKVILIVLLLVLLGSVLMAVISSR